MDGQKLKEKLITANVPFNEIAERMGITAQSLNSCFKVKDVRSNTIERIAKVIGVKMSFFYPMENNHAVASGNGSVAVTGNNNVASNVTLGDTAVLAERVKSLEALLAEKERLINVLMGTK